MRFRAANRAMQRIPQGETAAEIFPCAPRSNLLLSCCLRPASKRSALAACSAALGKGRRSAPAARNTPVVV